MAGSPFARHEENAPISDVNVVPLADVSLVLLIILLVLSPLAAQSMLKVSAAAVKAEPKGPTAEDLTPAPPPLPVVAVGLSPAGFVVEGRLLGGDAQLRAWLVPELKRRDERKVFLAPELEVEHGRVVEVVEWLKEAGASSVALVQADDEPSSR